MKTAYPHELKDRIYRLCNQKNYFDNGSPTQYEMMLDMTTEEDVSVRDVAIMIWTCSTTANLEEVEKELQDIIDALALLERLKSNKTYMDSMIAEKIPSQYIKLCEAVYDLSYELGYKAGKTLPVNMDSRDMFQEILSRAFQFELWLCPGDDYLIEIGEESQKLILDLYSTFGSAED